MSRSYAPSAHNAPDSVAETSIDPSDGGKLITFDLGTEAKGIASS